MNREQESEKMPSRQLLTSFRHGKVRFVVYIVAGGENAGGQSVSVFSLWMDVQ